MSTTMSSQPCDVRIVAGRRKLVWHDGDDARQKAYRPTPVKTVLPLRSSIVFSDESREMSWLSDLQLPEHPQKVPVSQLLPVKSGFDARRRASTGSHQHLREVDSAFSGDLRRYSHPQQSVDKNKDSQSEEKKEKQSSATIKQEYGEEKVDHSGSGNISGQSTRRRRGSRSPRRIVENQSDIMEKNEKSEELASKESRDCNTASSDHSARVPSLSELNQHDSEPNQIQQEEDRSSSGSHLVLPPISNYSRDGQTRKKLSELEEIILKNAIQRQYEVIVERHVQAMLTEMRTADNQSAGILERSIVQHLLQSYHLTFTPDADEYLLIKFEEEQGGINYESLVGFLVSAKLSCLNSPGRNTSLSGETMSSSRPPPRRGPSFTERDEHRLLSDLAVFMRLHETDRQDITDVLYKLDRARNGHLTVHQVQAALHMLGLEDMPEDLQRRLCMATDKTCSGVCDVEKLIRYLERARPVVQRASIPGLGENHKPRAPKEPKPLLNDMVVPNRSQAKLAPLSRLSIGSAVMSSASTVASSANRAPALSDWLRDFAKLTAELRRHDNEGSGFVSCNDATQTANSFNTIYDLHLTSDMVHRSLKHAHSLQYDMVNIERFTDSLKRRRLSAA